MKFLKIGSRVLVRVPLEDSQTHKAVAKYNGKEMKIAKRVLLKHQSRVYYELDGAKINGMPLSFVGEWLIPLEERSE